MPTIDYPTKDFLWHRTKRFIFRFYDVCVYVYIIWKGGCLISQCIHVVHARRS